MPWSRQESERLLEKGVEPRWREGTLGLPRLQPLRGLSPPTGMHAQALTTPCAVCQWLGVCRGVEETALSSHPLLLRGGSSIWAGLWAGLSGAALLKHYLPRKQKL